MIPRSIPSLRTPGRRRLALAAPTLAALALGALALVALPLAAAEPWSVDDVVLAERASDWQLSADGSLAAWIQRGVRTVDGEEKPVAHLWLCRLDGGAPVQLTRGVERVTAIAIAPDAAYVAFASDRDQPADRKKLPAGAGRQLWAIATGGGEAFPVTGFERAVEAFAWIDADTLAVAAAESPSRWEMGREKAHDDTRTVDDHQHQPPTRLFRVKLDGSSRRLTANDGWIQTLAVSPGGARAVIVVQQSLSYNFDQKVPPHTYLVALDSGAMTRLFADGAIRPSRIAWASDGESFYLDNERTSHPFYRTATITELYRHRPASRVTAAVDLDWPRGVGGDFVATADGVAVLLADGVRFRPALIRRAGDGWRRSDLRGEHVRNLDALTLSGDGRTALYQTSSATVPAQGYSARLDGDHLLEPRRLTALNERYAGKATGRVEVLRYAGAEGDEVEALLHYPLDWDHAAPAPRPLIVDIHGGPAGTDRDSWDLRWPGPNLLWRQRGAFVLQVNYHGSAGYGLEWVESIAGHYYELEIPDIRAGVDLLIARGLADPARLGSIGWSNGGILTAELITRDPRFKVASVGAADVEWISDWANVSFGAAFDNYYFGGPPWERLDHYIEKSPFFRLAAVTAPTLIHTGTEDVNVPPHQSWSLFRALQQLGNTEAKLLIYPGEPHGLRDAERLRAVSSRLGAPAPLLLPVGTLGAVAGGAFDLDGNAAEWAVGEGGAGVAAGRSADRARDPRAVEPPAAAYIGLRVIVDGGDGG